MRNRFKTELKITPEIEQQYLDAALRVMKKHNVQIDDLHAAHNSGVHGCPRSAR